MRENLLVKGGKKMFILAYSVISFIVLLSLFLKHKYKISGMGVVLLLLIFVFIFIETTFDFDFSLARISSASERLFLLPFVKPVQAVLRGNDTAMSLVLHYFKYLSLGAAMAVAVNFLKKENALRNLIIFEGIMCALNLFDSLFTYACFDSGLYIVLFAGIVSGCAVTKNINLNLAFSEEDYE